MSKELMRQNIEKAQREIEIKRKTVGRGQLRQRYHFMAETGWINDPNGLIYFKGKYHFFYQYNPYSSFWNYLHWGHAISDDLLHWEYLPIALAPSEWYDDYEKGGCFSGSAIEHDGKLFLMYTGATSRGNGYEQFQCIAYSEDGINFEKYQGNPVLSAPEGILSDSFRDPKVWKHDGDYYMICGANKSGMAQALLYRSKDMFHWDFFNVLTESRGEWGYMWECLDFYPLGDKYVFMFSPMGIRERKSVYQVGDFNYQTGKFYPYIFGETDWGFDFYAPQSFLAGDGRRIMVGWANGWEWMPFWKDWGPTFQEGWCGFFNIPRTIELSKDNTLIMKPVDELKMLRGRKYEYFNLKIINRENIVVADTCVFEMKLQINLEKTTAAQIDIELRCSMEKKTILTLDLKHSELRLDRNRADGWSKGIVCAPVNLSNRKMYDIHIFSDRSSIEIFSNQYQSNLSCNIYGEKGQDQNYIKAKDGVAYIDKIETWDLLMARKQVTGCIEEI